MDGRPVGTRRLGCGVAASPLPPRYRSASRGATPRQSAPPRLAGPLEDGARNSTHQEEEEDDVDRPEGLYSAVATIVLLRMDVVPVHVPLSIMTRSTLIHSAWFAGHHSPLEAVSQQNHRESSPGLDRPEEPSGGEWPSPRDTVPSVISVVLSCASDRLYGLVGSGEGDSALLPWLQDEPGGTAGCSFANGSPARLGCVSVSDLKKHDTSGRGWRRKGKDSADGVYQGDALRRLVGRCTEGPL